MGRERVTRGATATTTEQGVPLLFIMLCHTMSYVSHHAHAHSGDGGACVASVVCVCVWAGCVHVHVRVYGVKFYTAKESISPPCASSSPSPSPSALSRHGGGPLSFPCSTSLLLWLAWRCYRPSHVHASIGILCLLFSWFQDLHTRKEAGRHSVGMTYARYR